MKTFKVLAFMALAMVAAPAFAGAIAFQIGDAGFDNPGNNWPDGEAPEFAIDGLGQKYLNFGRNFTGIAVTPASGASTAASITVWAANDSPDRDPVSFQVYGMDGAVSGGPGDLISGFTLIAEDTITLPNSRNAGGDEPLYAANSGTTFFDNNVAYESYVIVFPSTKAGDAQGCCMQAAEIQLNVEGGAPIFAAGDEIRGGQIVPEPSTCLLALFGSVLLGCRIRS